MKIGEKLRNIIGLAAPKLGLALGGPLGGLAGTLVANALGTDDEAQAMAAIQSDPDKLLALKKAEQDFEARMTELGIQEEQLEAQDRASARDLAIKTNFWPQVILTALFVCGYFTILGLFFAQQLRVPENEAFTVMLGVLTAGVPQILAFWFGSSHGSQQKDATLAKIAQEP